MNLYHQIIGICWLAFLAAWAILAMVFGGNSRQRNYSSRALGARLFLLVAVILGFRFSGSIPMQQFGDLPSAAA